jgi:DNA-directed RNA polymerase specialized sigma24 family protein
VRPPGERHLQQEHNESEHDESDEPMNDDSRRADAQPAGGTSSQEHDETPPLSRHRRAAEAFVTLDFSRDWEAAAGSVVRSLTWQGFDRPLAEDATQEAGARFLEGRAAGSNIVTPLQFQRWLYVVARNLAIDHQRRAAAANGKLPAPVPSPPADEVAEHRLKWEAAMGRLAQMDRPYHVLAGELLGQPRRGPRENVERKRLERLRKRLSEAIATAVGAAALLRYQTEERTQRVALGMAAVASVTALMLPVGGHARATTAVIVARRAAAAVSTRPPPLVALRRATPARVVVDRAGGAPTPAAAVRPSPPAGGEARVDVTTPSGAPVATAGTRPNDDTKPIVCARNFPAVGTHCVDRPITVVVGPLPH